MQGHQFLERYYGSSKLHELFSICLLACFLIEYYYKFINIERQHLFCSFCYIIRFCIFGDVVDYVYLPPNFSKYYALLVLSLLMERICIENSFQSRSSKNSLTPRFQSLFRCAA